MLSYSLRFMLVVIAVISTVGCGQNSLDLVDPWEEPRSIERIVAVHPNIAIGTISAKLDTVTITENVPMDLLTAVASDGQAFAPETTEYGQFAFEITDVLKSDGAVHEGMTVTLRAGGPNAGTNGYPPDVGATYIFFGGTYFLDAPDTIAPLGGGFGLIQANVLDGEVLYSSDDPVPWASSMTVQEFINALVDEIGG